MTNFENLFRNSRGSAISYAGRDLYLVDHFPVEPGLQVRVTRESTKSRFRQGIMIKADGILEVNGTRYSVPLLLWEDTSPQEVQVAVVEGTKLEIRNVWDLGDGVPQSWHNGAAMAIEMLATGRRYRCNDGDPDDDLDDIVFRVEVVSA